MFIHRAVLTSKTESFPERVRSQNAHLKKSLNACFWFSASVSRSAIGNITTLEKKRFICNEITTINDEPHNNGRLAKITKKELQTKHKNGKMSLYELQQTASFKLPKFLQHSCTGHLRWRCFLSSVTLHQISYKIYLAISTKFYVPADLYIIVKHFKWNTEISRSGSILT